MTTITQKGQVTLSKKIREMLGISTYDRVIVETAKDHVKIRPTEDILDLAATFKPRHKKSLSKARKILEKSYQRC